jgi:hypothetical protein
VYCHCRYVGQDDEGTRGWKSASRVKKCTPVLKFEIQVPLSESPSEPSHWLTWQQCSGTHNSLEIVLLVICCTRERPSSYYIHQKPRALLNRFHQQLCTRQCQFVRHMPHIWVFLSLTNAYYSLFGFRQLAVTLQSTARPGDFGVITVGRYHRGQCSLASRCGICSTRYDEAAWRAPLIVSEYSPEPR